MHVLCGLLNGTLPSTSVSYLVTSLYFPSTIEDISFATWGYSLSQTICSVLVYSCFKSDFSCGKCMLS